MKNRCDVRGFISAREEELPATEFVRIMKIAEEDKNIISLGPGEPDFVTPKNIRDVAKKKLDQGHTHYTPIGGLEETKEAIAEKLKHENKIDVDPDSQIIVTVGAKEAILLSLMAMIDPGDGVIVPNPGYVAFIPIVESLTAVPLSVQLKREEGFEYNLDRVKSLLDSQKVKVLILNSPSNPTGTVFSKKHLEEIADFIIDNCLVVVSDEAYEKFVYDDAKHISIGSLNGMENHVVTIHSFSKTYAMPGFRIGYASGPADIIKAMTRLKIGTTLSTPTISQLAAIEALNGNQKSIKVMVKEYNRRRKFLMKRMKQIKGFNCFEPKGAFYAFPNISEFSMKSHEFAEFLLKKAKVLTIPGTEFGKYGEGFIRLSYATDYKKIVKAMNNIELAIRKLKLH